MDMMQEVLREIPGAGNLLSVPIWRFFAPLYVACFLPACFCAAQKACWQPFHFHRLQPGLFSPLPKVFWIHEGNRPFPGRFPGWFSGIFVLAGPRIHRTLPWIYTNTVFVVMPGNTMSGIPAMNYQLAGVPVLYVVFL